MRILLLKVRLISASSIYFSIKNHPKGIGNFGLIGSFSRIMKGFEIRWATVFFGERKASLVGAF
jgi:hypothetical protein